MKASPLLISWHNENAPIYSIHIEPHGKGRIATSAGDNNVRLWKLDVDGDERKVSYLTTLSKHTQAVNVVRFAPKGEMIATAGDDGNTLLWVPSETHLPTQSFGGQDHTEDKETWRIKHMCRSFGSEIYDLAWSPDGVFFITGSMDNIARIYNAQTGQMVRQIAEHNHYVQGVAWDPLNEFVATQSSDRSVHIYNLKTKDGQFTLNQYNKITKMDVPGRRISSSSPAPPDLGLRSHILPEGSASLAPASPAPSPSIPGTPTSLALPMNPPAISHSRRSSFGSSPSMRRSASPAPSMPLPAVRPMESSPNPFGSKGACFYANETFTTFFRRLTFAPEGSLLFTPAGQYKTLHPPSTDGLGKPGEDVINTVYIYTRAGFNKPPVTHLPGHKKPSIAVKCSPIFYTYRPGPKHTVHITLDTSSADEAIPALPDPIVSSAVPATNASMEPPPLSSVTMPSPSDISRPTSSPRPSDGDSSLVPNGPPPAFALPYRIVYAVATQDAVLVYDTQQLSPLCIVSNLHFATFTDLAWTNDGLTLLMSSSDGFVSSLAFSSGDLGQVYNGHVPTAHHPNLSVSVSSSTQASPMPTPTTAAAPALPKQSLPSPVSSSSMANARPPTPTRSNSASSIATLSSYPQTPAAMVVSNPTPTLGNVPSVAATNSAPAGLPLNTPPQTPMSNSAATAVQGTILGKRDATASSESEMEDNKEGPKRRRIAPTVVRPADG